jgi:hypothetical protein
MNIKKVQRVLTSIDGVMGIMITYDTGEKLKLSTIDLKLLLEMADRDGSDYWWLSSDLYSELQDLKTRIEAEKLKKTAKRIDDMTETPTGC